jgi:hypothetical protein
LRPCSVAHLKHLEPALKQDCDLAAIFRLSFQDEIQIAAQVDAAVGYMDKAKTEVTQSLDKIKGAGWKGVKEKALAYTRQEPLNALALAAAAGILVAWVAKRGK